MITAHDLLPRFLQAYPFQPATGIWRAVEVAALVNHGIPEGRGLDVGCGDGLLTSIIDAQLKGKRTWVGIDPDPAEIAMARDTGLYEQCLVAGGGSLPLESASFDFALSNSVLEHIRDLRPVLFEVARILKPKGQFLITVPSNNFHTALRGPLWPDADRARYLRAIDRRCAHIHYWGEDTWREELAGAGLSLTLAAPYLDRAETQRWETCSRFTGGLLYALFRGKQQPIQIQRKLGMRNHSRSLPRPIANLGARLLSGALDQHVGPPYACLLLVAKKS
ncbi:MAG: class I SAM-dependent methyltransferase [Curvibacter sp.]|nr:class I SAM-dependent methyltransferase [Curvibacter sp.]